VSVAAELLEIDSEIVRVPLADLDWSGEGDCDLIVVCVRVKVLVSDKLAVSREGLKSRLILCESMLVAEKVTEGYEAVVVLDSC
jgi:hypothetical protein